jgi:hypothetical protein
VLAYVPGLRIVAFTPTAVTVLAELFNCPLAGVTVSQLAAEMAFQLIVPAQLEVVLKVRD